jgi:2',3'-cyclic-nucleotide 2'-phosphodiesterase (5'-nucleotidase family)
MSDAMLAAFPGADLALTNSGGIRADLPAGPLRREHIQAVMPFDNRIVLVEMPGDRLELLLRIGSSGGHGVLQVAGGTYGFDPAITAGTDLDADGAVADWERDRLCDAAVKVGGKPIDAKRTYKVVTTDFLVGGGDHLGPAFEGLPVVQGELLRDHLAAWSAGLGTCRAPDPTVRIAQGACK